MKSAWWKDESDLIEEQGAILDIPPHKSLLIKGPPGSGKTNLLLLRANYLALGSHPNLQVVVFGSLLKGFIQIGGVQYKFPPDRVTTHARLFDAILRENGVGIDTNGMDLAEAREARATGVEALIKGGKIGKLFDAVLLDEAQDYTVREISIFNEISNVLVAAADEFQKVFNGDDCLPTLNNLVDVTHSLEFHFRNGRDICRIADEILKGYPHHVPLLKTSQYDEKSYPVKISIKKDLSILEQADAIAVQIQDQLVAYPEETIGVLCPRNEEVASIAKALNDLGHGDKITICKDPDFNPDAPVWLATMSAAKGLEFRCVHIAGLDYLSKMGAVQKRLAYTAVTRAKTALSFYYQSSIPPYLAGALNVVSPSTKAITRSRIFGKD
jgi:superfamily I DNA and RNA helicase